jgi:acetyl-CoA acetyltransferase
MIETGATEHDLASIALSASANASLNPRAFRKKKITEADYFASPYIAEPFRRLDCTVEVDGACAVLVTSLERARDLELAPAVITSSSWNTHRFDTDMASNLCYDDFSKNYAAYMRDRLWGMAGLKPLEVDVASLYDCFTGVLLQNVEAYGLAGRGEGGEYVRRQAKDPKLPKLNPSGGLLCEGYLHGMNVLAEAVWQVQGVAGPTQKPGARTAVTCSAGGISGSALVLTRDPQRSGGA